jgi:hypothetical protein
LTDFVQFECFAALKVRMMGIMGVMGIMKVVKNRYSVAKTKSQSLKNSSSVMGDNEPFSKVATKAETEKFASKERYPVRQIPTKRSQISHPISAPKPTLKMTKKSPTLEVGKGEKREQILPKERGISQAQCHTEDNHKPDHCQDTIEPFDTPLPDLTKTRLNLLTARRLHTNIDHAEKGPKKH